MRDNYDFSDGIKNPYAASLKQGYSVTIHYDLTAKEMLDEDAAVEKKADKDKTEPQQA